MRRRLGGIIWLVTLWVAYDLTACPLPKVDWSPNPVCVGCESVITLGYTTNIVDYEDYKVKNGPWIDPPPDFQTNGNSPTAAGTYVGGDTAGVIQWSAPGYCDVVITAGLEWECLSNGKSGTTNIIISTNFIVARMDTLTLTDADNGNNSRQDTTDDDATPTNNTLFVGEDTNGQARVVLDLALTPTNANVGYLFKWQIAGGGWSPAEGSFADGAITSVWTDAGGAVEREFTVQVVCDCGYGGNCGYCTYRRMLKIAVVKVDLDGEEPDGVGGFNPVDDEKDFSPGILLVSSASKLVVQNPGVNSGILTLSWPSPVEVGKKLEVNGDSDGTYEIDCSAVTAWPVKLLLKTLKETAGVWAEGTWDYEDSVEVTMTHSNFSGCEDKVRLILLKIEIEADLKDQPPSGKTYASGINPNSIVLKLNGTQVTPTITDITDGKHVRYSSVCSELNIPGNNTVELKIRDNANAGVMEDQDMNDAGNATDPDPFTWSFALP